MPLLTWWLAFARNLRRERAFTTQQLETQDVYTVPLGRSAPEPVAAPEPAAGKPTATSG